ncbi:hypothetical protein ABFS82_08G211600 [Erythranthe guttata]
MTPGVQQLCCLMILRMLIIYAKYSICAFAGTYYCAALGMNFEHPLVYVHTQNRLAESLIKRVQIIARTLLMRSKLTSAAWGHAVLHASTLIKLRPTAYHMHSPMQLALGFEPDISHIRTFGCAVQVSILPHQRTKMGPQRRLGIYVGFDSPSIIRFLEPITGDLFTARFADCHFDETLFIPIGKDIQNIRDNDKQKPIENLTWCEQHLSHLDPRTSECENEIHRIIHLQNIANRLHDAFNDASKVTKSYIPAVNMPARIAVLEEHAKMNDDLPRQKWGRPIGSKDVVPRKKKGENR